MRGDIEKWCRECSTCAVGRNEKHDQKAPLHPIVSQTPLEIVAIDHVKLEPSRSGYTYAMTIIDHYTKFVVAVPVKDLTAKTTADAFWKHFLLPYGCPERILTDQGSAFESQLFKELCTLHNCQKIRTTAYHPQGNGLCEKMNQTLIEMLRAVPPATISDWPTLLPQLMYTYNNTIHCSTGYTPYYLMFGRQGKLPADHTLGVQVYCYPLQDAGLSINPCTRNLHEHMNISIGVILRHDINLLLFRLIAFYKEHKILTQEMLICERTFPAYSFCGKKKGDVLSEMQVQQISAVCVFIFIFFLKAIARVPPFTN
ncbi:lymphocyte antigen 86 [Rana temporaria]|uniref:lymphocyte antigen 86 n=1 Tax=Rana temporaria TaxID=8407 RepID=UPI001AAD844C|nr:lymphocyte antigen 86 [Rana temporaria]